MEDIIVKGWSGSTLTLKEDSVIVCMLKKETVIPISQIVSVEVKDPKKLKGGTIKLKLGGAPDTFLQVTSFLALGNSNDIEFHHTIEYTEDAHRIKDYIAAYAGKKSSPAPGPSAADEIMKFKALLDDGIITEEEFAMKKKQLLGI